MKPDAHLSPETPVDPPAGYREDLDRVVPLSDGTALRIRPIVPDDIERLRNAFAASDAETIRRRFLTGAPPTGDKRLRYLVEIDYSTRLALLGLDLDGNSVGIARYEGSRGSRTAEVAIAVDLAWRRRRIATVLLEALEGPALESGFLRFEAIYAPDNRGAADLFEGLGYTGRHLDEGLVYVVKALP